MSIWSSVCPHKPYSIPSGSFYFSPKWVKSLSAWSSPCVPTVHLRHWPLSLWQMIKLTHLKGLLRVFKPKNGLTVKRLLSMENLPKLEYLNLYIPDPNAKRSEAIKQSNFKFRIAPFSIQLFSKMSSLICLTLVVEHFKLATLSHEII